MKPDTSKDCLSVKDARLIASELRACAMDIAAVRLTARPEGRPCLDRVTRALDVTAQSIEKWAMAVMMRRGDDRPPESTGTRPTLPPDPAWQSSRKESDAGPHKV